MAKIHAYANAGHTYARCASHARPSGKVTRNTRAQYQYMASEIVPTALFKHVAPEKRCAHCCDILLLKWNKSRRDTGRPLLDFIPYVPSPLETSGDPQAHDVA
jgi:hypothetical protein